MKTKEEARQQFRERFKISQEDVDEGCWMPLYIAVTEDFIVEVWQAAEKATAISLLQKTANRLPGYVREELEKEYGLNDVLHFPFPKAKYTSTEPTKP